MKNATQVKQIEILSHRAISLHQAGQLAEAKYLSQQILEIDPSNVDALHTLALLVHKEGDSNAAIALLNKAIQLLPKSAILLTNLGCVYEDCGEQDKALQCYLDSITFDPTYALSPLKLASLLHQQNQWLAAIRYYQASIALDGSNPLAYYNLANTFYKLGEYEKAISNYLESLKLNPEYTDALFNLGNAYRELAQHHAAIQSYQAVLSIDPHYSAAYNHMGQVYLNQRDLNAAIQAFTQAITITPTLAGAINNLGIAYKLTNQLELACNHFQKAIELKSNFAEAYNNLASTQKELGKLKECIVNYTKAIQYKPNYASAKCSLLLIRLETCDWSNYPSDLAELEQLTSQALSNGTSNPLNAFSALTLPIPLELQHAIAADYTRQVLERVKDSQHLLVRKPNRTRNKRIRVGYLSPNFRNHPTSHLMIRLFGLHDREKFEIFTYTWGPDDGSEYRRIIQKDSDHFTDISEQTFLESAQRIVDDEIDILIDRAGYTKDCRSEILALRPAPVQVNYIGFPGSLQAPFIDYIIADSIVLPHKLAHAYSEKLIHLPNCYLVTDNNPPVTKRIPTRSSVGLPEDGFIFCCFNTNYKIDPVIFDAWMEILKRVPHAVLWLLRSSSLSVENLYRAAQQRGISKNRLIFAEKTKKDVHLSRHRLAHVFLDTPNYNAHTTAVDALWCGVPLISIVGNTFATRVAASILNAIGLPELIKTNLNEYISLAVELATQPDKYRSLKNKLTENRKTFPLFDNLTYTRNLESAYLAMWNNFLVHGNPEMIEVNL